MQHIVVFFASAQLAETKVAGVPAVARALREATIAAKLLHGQPTVSLFLCEGQLEDRWCLQEISRFAPDW